LEREADRVADDVRYDLVSEAAARDIYGVIVTKECKLDEKATDKRRAEIRAERLNWIAEKVLAGIPDAKAKGELVATVGDRASIQRVGGKAYFRCECGSCFAPAEENWKSYAKKALAAPADLGPRIALHAELEAVRYACPACARLHWVEIKMKGEAPLFDFELRT
jgi:N-methylhydantoinase B